MATQSCPLLDSFGSQWFWKAIVTPLGIVVPLITNIAVNNNPVVPVGRNDGKIIAARTVVGLSIVALAPQELPTMENEPAHSARGMEFAGIMLPVKSTPNGLSTECPLESRVEFIVISNPLKVSVLLIIIGTLSRVFGVVSGPLKMGPEAGHLVLTSAIEAIQTSPEGVAWTRGMNPVGIRIEIAISGRRAATDFLIRSVSPPFS